MFVAKQEYTFTHNNIKIVVTGDVYSCWMENRQLEPTNTEQFGVLVGSRAEDRNTIWIEKCTTPQFQDSSTRVRFTLRDKYHQAFIENEYESSHGKLGYIGTWHTHPESKPNPSKTDLSDWKNCTNRNHDRQLIFAIIGYSWVNIYILHNGNFEKLSRKIDD